MRVSTWLLVLAVVSAVVSILPGLGTAGHVVGAVIVVLLGVGVQIASVRERAALQREQAERDRQLATTIVDELQRRGLIAPAQMNAVREAVQRVTGTVNMTLPPPVMRGNGIVEQKKRAPE